MMARLFALAATVVAVIAMLVAFVAWPALIADGVVVQNAERADCLKHAMTGEEIRLCS